MTADDSRSEQVIEAYKRHKLSISALHRIRRLLQEFENQRIIDRKLGLFGIVVILSLLAVAAWLWLGRDSVVISRAGDVLASAIFFSS
jgi:sterol desaturase/sphingolipid hydroxylase (fatty acid hydroxylase superfamily)